MQTILAVLIWLVSFGVFFYVPILIRGTSTIDLVIGVVLGVFVATVVTSSLTKRLFP